MLDLFGPGIFGFSLILELTVGIFILMTNRPHFPYIRVAMFLVLFYLVFISFGIAEHNIGHQLVENVWHFLGRRLSGIF